MKKLFFTLVVFISNVSFSQVLLEQNCTNLQLGNISTVGGVAGQEGWRAFAPAGTPPSSFQIIDVGGQNGKVFQLQGASNDNENRFIVNNDLLTSWPNRTAGNDIIEVEFDFYTGANTASNSAIDFTVYDETAAIALCGIDYYPLSRRLYGVAYTLNQTTNVAANTYISPPSPIVLQPNTWYRLGSSFNKTTGQVLFKGTVNGVAFNFSANGAVANLNPGEVDLINVPQANGITATTNWLDNVVITAVANSTFLNNNNFENSNNFLRMSPNPANEFIKISNSENVKIKNIEIIDLNGRIIVTENCNNLTNVEINLQLISKGIYLLKINTENGFFTKKMVKN